MNDEHRARVAELSAELLRTTNEVAKNMDPPKRALINRLALKAAKRLKKLIQQL